jgi:hypothetical protein
MVIAQQIARGDEQPAWSSKAFGRTACPMKAHVDPVSTRRHKPLEI